VDKRFNCTECGNCCSKIRGKLSEEETEFLKENAYGKMPLFQLISIEESSFPLWDWEAKRFKAWADEVGVDAKIRPLRAMFDLDSNKTIIIAYHMDSDSCPFLSDKKCLIYDKKRAFVCRLFPFQRTPFLDIDEESDPSKLLGYCHVTNEVLDEIPRNNFEMVKWFNEYFSDGSFLNAVQNDISIAWTNKMIMELCKGEVIRPAINYPYDKLMKRVSNSVSVDFMDYLIEKKIKTKEEIETLIKRFDDNRDAVDKIKEFLG
jgi:Fe-S-cluster containining protein